jgi:hypothetical protein
MKGYARLTRPDTKTFVNQDIPLPSLSCKPPQTMNPTQKSPACSDASHKSQSNNVGSWYYKMQTQAWLQTAPTLLLPCQYHGSRAWALPISVFGLDEPPTER